MGAGDVIRAAEVLFARINTTKSTDGKNEILDKNEIQMANSLGFGSLFELKEGMTLAEFEHAYTEPSLYDTPEKSADFEKKERNIHVRYLQTQYKTTEVPNENETIADFEERLKNSMQEVQQDKPQFGA